MSGCDTPIIVITCHGAYHEEEYKSSKCNVYKVNATKVGIANYVKQDLLYIIPTAIEDALLETTCKSAIEKLQEKLSCTEYYNEHGNTLATPDARESQDYLNYTSDWKKKCLYDINKWNKTDVFLNKHYQISKNDEILDFLEDDEGNPLTDESGNLLDAYDNRIVMFLSNGNKIDLLPSWNKTSIPNNPTETLLKQRRTTFDITLEELINKVYDMGYNDIIIADLSCSVCSDDSGFKTDIRAHRHLNRQKRGGRRATRRRTRAGSHGWRSLRRQMTAGVSPKTYGNIALYNPNDPISNVRVFEADKIPINKNTGEVATDGTAEDDKIYENINLSKLKNTFDDISNWEKKEYDYVLKEFALPLCSHNDITTHDTEIPIEGTLIGRPKRTSSNLAALLNENVVSPSSDDATVLHKNYLKHLRLPPRPEEATRRKLFWKTKRDDETKLDFLKRLEKLRNPSSILSKVDDFAKKEEEEERKKIVSASNVARKGKAVYVPRRNNLRSKGDPAAPKEPTFDESQDNTVLQYDNVMLGLENSDEPERPRARRLRSRILRHAARQQNQRLGRGGFLNPPQDTLFYKSMEDAREYRNKLENKKLNLFIDKDFFEKQLSGHSEKIDNPEQNSLLWYLWPSKIDNPEYSQKLKQIDELNREYDSVVIMFEDADENWKKYLEIDKNEELKKWIDKEAKKHLWNKEDMDNFVITSHPYVNASGTKK